MSNLSGFVKRLRDVMRNDPGINGDAQRIEQIARVRKAGYNAAAEQYNTDVLDSPLTGWLLRLLGFEEIEKIY